MRRVLKIVRWLFVSMLILAVIVVGSGYLYLRQSLPQTEGVIKVSGLSGPIEIIRDVDGVPHIYAQHKNDAFFGLGYVHAQDRLWQMELWRRITQGRFAEIFGETALDRDRYLRTVGLQRAGESAWAQFPAQYKPSVESYSAGVNAFLADHQGMELPPEFTVLGVTPEPWTPVDSLAWGKIYAIDLASNLNSEILGHDLITALGPERGKQILQELIPDFPEDIPSLAPLQENEGSYEGLIDLNQELQAGLGIGGFHGGAKGSNSWAVDGTKSVTGKPLLANDPHFTMSVPGWYEAHISAPGFDAIGATIPGLPGIVIGRNRHIAWGFTSLNPDVQDLFFERLDPTGRMAEFEGKMEPMKIITETIKVKGQPDVEWVVRESRHGPLMSDLINFREKVVIPPDFQRPDDVAPLAMRWTGLNSEDTTVAAFLGLNDAQNWQEVQESLRNLVAPGLNFVYIDEAGNIGNQAAGYIPIRATGNGTLPLDGWSGKNEWTGWIPFDELPQMYNPATHSVITANNRPTGPTKHFVGREWAPPYRAERIAQLLEEKEQFSVDDFAAMQMDTLSLQANELLPILLRLVKAETPEQQQAIDLLTQWDGDTRGDSAATAIYEAWFISLTRPLISDELERKRLVIAYEANFNFLSRFLAKTLAEPDNPWCDNTTTDPSEDCADLAQTTFETALSTLRGRLGDDPTTWRWDELHRSIFNHVPLDESSFFRPFFSRSVPSGGDWSTVNLGAFYPVGPVARRYNSLFTFDHRFGASYRQVIDFSDPEGSRFIHTIGQSGHVLSPHYDDYISDWSAGRLRIMRIDRSLVERDRVATLRLEP